MRQMIATFMVSIGLRAHLTHAGVCSMCHVISTLVPSLDLEVPPGTSTDEHRMSVLIRLHREQPGGRAPTGTGAKDTHSDADQNDKLLANAEYLRVPGPIQRRGGAGRRKLRRSPCHQSARHT